MTLAWQAMQAMRDLPLATLDDILGPDCPVILSPHPDDETIGCGGLIAGAAARQRRPMVVFITDGSGSHPGSRRYPRQGLARLRQQEACNAASVLGLSHERLFFMGLRDTAAPVTGAEFDAAVRMISEFVARCAPCVIIAPWVHDPHCDHVAAHAMATSVRRRTGVRHLSYPVWGWTLDGGCDLGPVTPTGWRLDVRPLQARKRLALAAHASQMTDLIDDDPTGFRLTEDILATIMPAHETYLDNP
jgi:LmbE family N-acetylglucosaminyl deacetylase